VCASEQCDDGNDVDDDGCNNNCTHDCTIQTNAGHTYLFCYNVPLPWAQARNACMAAGMRMTSIQSDSENTWIYNTGANYQDPVSSWWIGFNDRDTEGVWVWEDGSTGNYTQWAPNEPNDAGGEDCGSLQDDETWADLPCEWADPYVCESL
jgi:hypothetical protein